MIDLFSYPLFGDVDVVRIIIFVVVILAWIAGQVFNNEKPRRVPQRRPARPKPAQVGPAAPPRMRQANRESLESEIGQFIKRTTQAGQQQARSQPPLREKLPPKPVRRVGQQPPAPQRGDSLNRPVVAEVAGSTRRPGGLAQQSSHLAGVIENRDEEMEAHLKGVFDHGVGKLRKGATSLSPSQTDAADSLGEQSPRFSTSGLIEMFRSPNDVRNAIIMSEILKRPEDRWSS